HGRQVCITPFCAANYHANCAPGARSVADQAEVARGVEIYPAASVLAERLRQLAERIGIEHAVGEGFVYRLRKESIRVERVVRQRIERRLVIRLDRRGTLRRGNRRGSRL